ncbi:hypothetical protein JTB14_008275 [Gonioctena quinquepunctata]|nr:hypothetical protein JTB14_008275 [Gonioctena quinquepunctata]
MLEFPKNGKNEGVDLSFTDERFMWLLNDECDTNSCFSSNNSNSDNAALEPVPLKHFPMGNLLSENEIQLCTNLNIQPIHYNTLKALIIQENLLAPGKQQSSTSDTDTSETNIKEAITQYLSYSGWLPGVSVV